MQTIRSQGLGKVIGVSDELASFVTAAAAAFADQLRRELGEWLPTLDPDELGGWAALIATEALRHSPKAPTSRVR